METLAERLFRRATFRNAFWPIALVLLLVGCGKPSVLPEGRTPPNPSAPARYGEYRPAAGTRAVPGADVKAAVSASTNRSTASFYILESELTPAVLVHSKSKYLGLFTGLGGQGLGAPSHVGWSTAGGPRAFKNGESIDVMRMEENWVLVWFAGATGWTNWDIPWAVFLQHRPASLKLDADGLHFTFSNRADDVVLMPLYGGEKAPLKGLDFRERHGLTPPKVPVKTWEWAAALPRDPLIRVRYWAGATRRLPIHCEESFSVNRAEDSIAFRWRFDWHSIEDDWKTKPLRLAPLSPTLALAVREPDFPARFKDRPFDLGMFTPAGPIHAVPDVDTIEAVFPFLQYVHESEAIVARGGTNRDPAVASAREQLSELARAFLALPAVAATDDAPWFATSWMVRTAPYLEPAERSNVLASVRARLGNHLDGRGEIQAPGFVAALWAYAHFSDDWDFVRRHWATIKGGADFGVKASWAGFGPESVVSIGALAAPAVGLARLAYQAGDLEAYHQACGRAARELVQLWARQRGIQFFREHQPVFSMEAMDGPLFLTEFDSNRPGWRFDGPRYPATANPQRSLERWSGFESSDVARFLQDYLRADVRRDLDPSGSSVGESESGSKEFPGRPAASSYLRSRLLDERPTVPPEPLLKSSTNRFREIGQKLAEIHGLLRLAEPVRYERLIASSPAGPFQLSPEPVMPIARAGVGCGMAVQVAVGSAATAGSPAVWPDLGWSEWRTPAGAAWTFGQIKGARHAGPRRIEVVPINRHARMIVCELP